MSNIISFDEGVLPATSDVLPSVARRFRICDGDTRPPRQARCLASYPEGGWRAQDTSRNGRGGGRLSSFSSTLFEVHVDYWSLSGFCLPTVDFVATSGPPITIYLDA